MHLKLHWPEVAQGAVEVVLRLVLVVGAEGVHPGPQTLVSGQLGALRSLLPGYPKHNTQACRKHTHKSKSTLV